MPIENVAAITFSNERCRLIANLAERSVRSIDQFLVEMIDYLAIPEIALLFAEFINGGTTQERKDEISAMVISDNADLDGRPICTFGKVLELKFVCEQLKACIDTSDRRALLSKLANNSTPIF
jgi:hypothetical protein